MPLSPNPLIPSGARRAIDRPLSRMRNRVCTVQRPGSDQDVGGATIYGTWGTTGVYECRVAPSGLNSQESVGGGQFGPESTLEVVLPRTAVVGNRDRIRVDGHTLQVVGSEQMRSHGMELRVTVTADR